MCSCCARGERRRWEAERTLTESPPSTASVILEPSCAPAPSERPARASAVPTGDGHWLTKKWRYTGSAHIAAPARVAHAAASSVVARARQRARALGQAPRACSHFLLSAAFKRRRRQLLLLPSSQSLHLLLLP